MKVTTISSVLGTIFSIYLNLLPSIPFLKVLKRKEKKEILHPIILFFQVIDNIFWGAVWTLKKESIPFINAIFGIFVSSFFIMLYFYLYYNRVLCKSLIRFLILFGIEFFIFLRIIIYGNIFVISIFALIFNTPIFFLQLREFILIIKQKYYKYINIHFTIVFICSSCSWLIYGIYIRFIFLIIPNSIGFLFSLVNAIIWIYFYKKRDVLKNKEDEISKIMQN